MIKLDSSWDGANVCSSWPVQDLNQKSTDWEFVIELQILLPKTLAARSVNQKKKTTIQPRSLTWWALKRIFLFGNYPLPVSGSILLLGGVNKKEAQEFVIDSHESYLLRIYMSSLTIHFNSFQSISLSNTLPYVQLIWKKFLDINLQTYVSYFKIKIKKRWEDLLCTFFCASSKELDKSPDLSVFVLFQTSSIRFAR